MAPFVQQGDHVSCDLSFVKKHPERMMPEEPLHSPGVDAGRNSEQAAIVEATFWNEHMQMRVESEKIAEGLNGDCGRGTAFESRTAKLK